MTALIIDLRGRMRSASVSEEPAGPLAARLEVLSERLGALEMRLAGVEGRMVALEGRMTALEGRMAGVEARLAVIQWMAFGILALQAMSLSLLLHLVTTGGV